MPAMTEKANRRGIRPLVVLLVVICVIVIVAALRLGCGRVQDDLVPSDQSEHAWGDDLPLTRVVLLFFPRPYGESLVAEPRRIIVEEGTAGLMKSALAELGKGPADEALLSPFNQGLKVRGVYSSVDGTTYVDLDPEDVEAVGRGLSEEITAVRAITNTLFFNFPQVNRVKLLVDGEPVRSLGGHVDLSGFLYPEEWLETSGLEFK
jgi:hypothetical protein